ncbi:MAG: MGMT family protein [Verrucomicrobiota bacterium]
MSEMTKRSPTEFEQLVYDAISKVPSGKVTTYKELARHIGCRSNQAVGQALRRNPFAPEVPCHRVVRTDLTLGGYAGATGGEKLRKKQRLLSEEAVQFRADGSVRPEHFFQFPR